MMRITLCICLMLITFPAIAYDLNSEKIEGISLDMTLDQAVSILEAKGYKKYSEEDENIRERIVLKKGPYTISVTRGFVVSVSDTLISRVTAKSDPSLLVGITQKKDIAGLALQDGHSYPKHCSIAVEAAEKFCNDGIETKNKDCSLKTRVELHDINDKFTLRYEALFMPGKHCYKLVARRPTYKK